MLREFIGGHLGNLTAGVRFAEYKRAGVLEGKVQGRDYNGYNYKRWTLIDPVKAKQFLAERHIRPMRADAVKFESPATATSANWTHAKNDDD